MTATSTSNLLGLLAALVAYVYVAHYVSVHPSLSIVQAGIQKIDFDMLHGRVPIVVTDRIVDVHDILSNIFKYQYSFISSPAHDTTWVRNSHKFLLVNVRADQTMQVAHPSANVRKNGDYEFVDVVMRSHQVLILPFGWWVCAPAAVDMYQLDDMVSKLVSYVF